MITKEQPKKAKPPYLLFGIIILMLSTAGLLLMQLKGETAGAAAGGEQAWFTVDDGQTWFADDAKLLPPFQHNGKTAYRCSVWTVDGGKTKFVSHLERLRPEAKQKAESMKNDPIGAATELAKIEVKLPLTGDKGWVDISSPNAPAIMRPKVPAGKGDDLQRVPPKE